MAREREDKLDPTQPTLIVQHGNTPRKYRRLEKAVLVLGRAPGCDLRLEAPEVAGVHCVIVRAADGWRVRDCTGRGGTRVNGQSVQDEALCDEDVLQVGSFSFAFHLPPERRRVADADRLQRSRQGLARLALRLRGRLREAAADVAGRVEERLAARQEELDRQAEELDDLRSDLDARLGEMRRTRQEIAEESVALIKRHERVEKELAERRAAQERAEAEAAGEAPRRLEIRARELGHYAAFLRRGRQRLGDDEKGLAAAREEIGRQSAEAEEDRLGAAALRQFPFEIEEDRRGLAERVLGIQGRYTDLEKAAREAELQIAQDRERIAQGRERLELVRQGLRQSADRSATQETMVDMPSPLHRVAEPEPCDATAEPPREPSRLSVAGG